MDLLNSVEWILSESMDLPDIFHSTEIHTQLLWKIKIYSTSNTSPYNFHIMDLLNSMEWILTESMDLPDIFHCMKIYNYYGQSKSILLPIQVHIISRSLIY